jgi:hypothetical protein
MLLQVLVAVAAGGGAIIFGMRKKIKAFFKRNKNTAVNISQQSSEGGEVIDMLADENKG